MYQTDCYKDMICEIIYEKLVFSVNNSRQYKGVRNYEGKVFKDKMRH